MQKIVIAAMFTLILISCSSGPTEDQIAATIEIAMQQTLEAQPPTATTAATNSPEPTSTKVPTETPKPTYTAAPADIPQPTDTPKPNQTVPEKFRSWVSYQMLAGDAEIIHPFREDWVYREEELHSVTMGDSTTTISFFDHVSSETIVPEEYFKDIELQKRLIKMGVATYADNISFDSEVAFDEAVSPDGEERLIVLSGEQIRRDGKKVPFYATAMPNGGKLLVAILGVRERSSGGYYIPDLAIEILAANAWVGGHGLTLDNSDLPGERMILTDNTTMSLNIAMRSEPGIDGEIIERLPDETVVYYLDQKQIVDDIEWYQIQTESGVIGWVSETFIAN